MRRHVDEQRRPLEDPARRQHRARPRSISAIVGATSASTTAGCRCRAAGARRSSDGVDLRLVAVAARRAASSARSSPPPRRAATQPLDERAPRVARRHDDRRVDLGPVGERHADDPVAVAADAGRPCAPVRTAPPAADDGRRQRLGQRAAAADRPADARRRGASRTPSAPSPVPRRLRADAPHHRPADERRPAQRVVGEVRAHHVGRAAPAPAQHRRRRRPAAGARRSRVRPADRRRFGRPRRRISSHGRPGRPQVAPVAVDLAGVASRRARRSCARRRGSAATRPARPGHGRRRSAPCRGSAARASRGRGRRSPASCGTSGGRSCRC